jgi:cell wall-associated NlpC family hydrolase
MASWRQGGRSLPHSSQAQYSATTHVPVSAVQPGDLVFFGHPIHHVGIYVGGGQMIAAPQTGRNVQYQGIYRGDLVGVGRP